MTFRCRDCGEPCDSPMLRDELWKQVSPPGEAEKHHADNSGVGRPRDLLCITCVERRLGRTIYVEDLNNSLWSQVVRAVASREVARALGGENV